MKGVNKMGFVAWSNGKGYTVQIDDDGVHLVEALRKCEACGDDRVLQGRQLCVQCYRIVTFKAD
jgi:hypothetical protein